jgi:predicted MFS family arabinose efflux permease
MGLLAVVAAADGPVIVALLLAALTTAAGTAYLPAFVATVPGLVGEEDLVAANSAVSLVENLSIIAGPALGAALLALGSPALAFALNAASFLVGALLALTVAPAPPPAAAASLATDGKHLAAYGRRLAVGARALADSRSARVLSGYLLGSSFVYGLQTVVFVIMANERLGTGEKGVGALYVALGAGGLLAATSIGRLARGAHLGFVLLGGLALTAVPMALLATTHDATLAFVMMVVSGAGMIVVDVLGLTLLQRVMPQEAIGRVWGILDSLIVAAILLGALLVGPFVDAIGTTPAFVTLALVPPLLALAGVRALAEVNRTSAAVLTRLAPIIAAFEGLGLLEGASRGVIEVLARDAVSQRVAAGTDVVTEGEPADHFYVVADGRLEVSKHSPGGDTVLAELGPGDYFGEIGLLRRVPRTATVRALEPTELYRVDGSQFLDAVNGAPTMSASLMERAAARLAAQERS